MAVAGAFLLQQVAFAAPGAGSLSLFRGRGASLSFLFPDSIATIEDVYDAGRVNLHSGEERRIFLIQDAHTNESGQMNIARALDVILEAEGIDHVFTEAGQGDNSLSFIKDLADRKTRERVLQSYLRKGLLQGSEYLSVTGDRDFVLWGVEDRGLYEEAIHTYRKVGESRDEVLAYLHRVEGTIETLKGRIYGNALRKFDAACQAYLKEKLALTEYYGLLIVTAEGLGIDLGRYEHLRFLRKLKTVEAGIDFEAADREQESLLASLPEEERRPLLEAARSEGYSPFKVTGSNRKAAKAFYALLEDAARKSAGTESASYSELLKYCAYLKAAKKLDAQSVLEEQGVLEAAVFAGLASTKDERYLVRFSKNVRILKHLFELKITPAEYGDYTSHKAEFAVPVITGFLNKKIMDLDKHYDRALLLKEDYGDKIAQAEKFYELTYRRDVVFLDRMFRKMEEKDLDQAVLITGGYHTPNLKALLKRRGVSYVSVLPQVIHETDHERYERIILSQFRGEEDRRFLARSHTNALEHYGEAVSAVMGLPVLSGLKHPRKRLYALMLILMDLGATRARIDEAISRLMAKLPVPGALPAVAVPQAADAGRLADARTVSLQQLGGLVSEDFMERLRTTAGYWPVWSTDPRDKLFCRYGHNARTRQFANTLMRLATEKHGASLSLHALALIAMMHDAADNPLSHYARGGIKAAMGPDFFKGEDDDSYRILTRWMNSRGITVSSEDKRFIEEIGRMRKSRTSKEGRMSLSPEARLVLTSHYAIDRIEDVLAAVILGHVSADDPALEDYRRMFGENILDNWKQLTDGTTLSQRIIQGARYFLNNHLIDRDMEWPEEGREQLTAFQENFVKARIFQAQRDALHMDRIKQEVIGVLELLKRRHSSPAEAYDAFLRMTDLQFFETANQARAAGVSPGGSSPIKDWEVYLVREAAARLADEGASAPEVTAEEIKNSYLARLQELGESAREAHQTSRLAWGSHLVTCRHYIKKMAGIDLPEDAGLLHPDELEKLRELTAFAGEAERKAALSKYSEEEPGGRVVILGVGQGYDLPLLELALRYSEVIWVDLDESLMNPAKKRLEGELTALELGAERVEAILSRVKMHTEDLTGLLEDYSEGMARILNDASGGEEATKQAVELFGELSLKPFKALGLEGQYGLVISGQVMSQLTGSLIAHTRDLLQQRVGPSPYFRALGITRKVLDFRFRIQKSHVAHLGQLAGDGGVVYWSDTFARVPVMLLPEGQGERYVIGEAVQTLNLGELLQLLEPVFDFAKIGEWGWTETPPTEEEQGAGYLVTAFALRPNSAAQEPSAAEAAGTTSADSFLKAIQQIVMDLVRVRVPSSREGFVSTEAGEAARTQAYREKIGQLKDRLEEVKAGFEEFTGARNLPDNSGLHRKFRILYADCWVRIHTLQVYGTTEAPPLPSFGDLKEMFSETSRWTLPPLYIQILVVWANYEPSEMLAFLDDSRRLIEEGGVYRENILALAQLFAMMLGSMRNLLARMPQGAAETRTVIPERLRELYESTYAFAVDLMINDATQFYREVLKRFPDYEEGKQAALIEASALFLQRRTEQGLPSSPPLPYVMQDWDLFMPGAGYLAQSYALISDAGDVDPEAAGWLAELSAGRYGKEITQPQAADLFADTAREIRDDVVASGDEDAARLADTGDFTGSFALPEMPPDVDKAWTAEEVEPVVLSNHEELRRAIVEFGQNPPKLDEPVIRLVFPENGPAMTFIPIASAFDERVGKGQRIIDLGLFLDSGILTPEQVEGAMRDGRMLDLIDSLGEDAAPVWADEGQTRMNGAERLCLRFWDAANRVMARFFDADADSMPYIELYPTDLEDREEPESGIDFLALMYEDAQDPFDAEKAASVFLALLRAYEDIADIAGRDFSWTLERHPRGITVKYNPFGPQEAARAAEAFDLDALEQALLEGDLETAEDQVFLNLKAARIHREGIDAIDHELTGRHFEQWDKMIRTVAGYYETAREGIEVTFAEDGDVAGVQGIRDFWLFIPSIGSVYMKYAGASRNKVTYKINFDDEPVGHVWFEIMKSADELVMTDDVTADIRDDAGDEAFQENLWLSLIAWFDPLKFNRWDRGHEVFEGVPRPDERRRWPGAARLADDEKSSPIKIMFGNILSRVTGGEDRSRLGDFQLAGESVTKRMETFHGMLLRMIVVFQNGRGYFLTGDYFRRYDYEDVFGDYSRILHELHGVLGDALNHWYDPLADRRYSRNILASFQRRLKPVAEKMPRFVKSLPFPEVSEGVRDALLDAARVQQTIEVIVRDLDRDASAARLAGEGRDASSEGFLEQFRGETYRPILTEKLGFVSFAAARLRSGKTLRQLWKEYLWKLYRGREESMCVEELDAEVRNFHVKLAENSSNEVLARVYLQGLRGLGMRQKPELIKALEAWQFRNAPEPKIATREVIQIMEDLSALGVMPFEASRFFGWEAENLHKALARMDYVITGGSANRFEIDMINGGLSNHRQEVLGALKPEAEDGEAKEGKLPERFNRLADIMRKIAEKRTVGARLGAPEQDPVQMKIIQLAHVIGSDTSIEPASILGLVPHLEKMQKLEALKALRDAVENRPEPFDKRTGDFYPMYDWLAKAAGSMDYDAFMRFTALLGDVAPYIDGGKHGASCGINLPEIAIRVQDKESLSMIGKAMVRAIRGGHEFDEVLLSTGEYFRTLQPALSEQYVVFLKAAFRWILDHPGSNYFIIVNVLLKSLLDHVALESEIPLFLGIIHGFIIEVEARFGPLTLAAIRHDSGLGSDPYADSPSEGTAIAIRAAYEIRSFLASQASVNEFRKSVTDFTDTLPSPGFGPAARLSEKGEAGRKYEARYLASAGRLAAKYSAEFADRLTQAIHRNSFPEVLNFVESNLEWARQFRNSIGMHDPRFTEPEIALLDEAIETASGSRAANPVEEMLADLHIWKKSDDVRGVLYIPAEESKALGISRVSLYERFGTRLDFDFNDPAVRALGIYPDGRLYFHQAQSHGGRDERLNITYTARVMKIGTVGGHIAFILNADDFRRIHQAARIRMPAWILPEGASADEKLEVIFDNKAPETQLGSRARRTLRGARLADERPFPGRRQGRVLRLDLLEKILEDNYRPNPYQLERSKMFASRAKWTGGYFSVLWDEGSLSVMHIDGAGRGEYVLQWQDEDLVRWDRNALLDETQRRNQIELSSIDALAEALEFARAQREAMEEAARSLKGAAAIEAGIRVRISEIFDFISIEDEAEQLMLMRLLFKTMRWAHRSPWGRNLKFYIDDADWDRVPEKARSFWEALAGEERTDYIRIGRPTESFIFNWYTAGQSRVGGEFNVRLKTLARGDMQLWARVIADPLKAVLGVAPEAGQAGADSASLFARAKTMPAELYEELVTGLNNPPGMPFALLKAYQAEDGFEFGPDQHMKIWRIPLDQYLRGAGMAAASLDVSV